MTKSYDLVTYYYKGHSPLKKQDNSFLMCLYTMLVILFILVIVLCVTSIHYSEPILKRKIIVEEKNPEYEMLKYTNRIIATTEAIEYKTTDNTEKVETTIKQDLINWKKIANFFIGEDQSTESSNKITDDLDGDYPKFNFNNEDVNEPILESNFEPSQPMSSSVPSSTTSVPTSTTAATHIEETEDPVWASIFGDANSLTGNSSAHFESKPFIFKSVDTCNTPECETIASKLISSINLSVEPCENFYEFACGGVSKQKKPEIGIFDSDILRDSNSVGFIKRFRMFYKNCIAHEDEFDYENRITKTKILLKDLNFLQFNEDIKLNANITDIVASMVLLDTMPFFHVGVDVSHDGTFVLKLFPPNKTPSEVNHWSPLLEIIRKCRRKTEYNVQTSTPLNITLLYITYQNCLKNSANYLKSVETSLKELGNFKNLTKEDIDEIIDNMKQFLKHQIMPMLDRIPNPSKVQEKLGKKQFVYMTIDEFQNEFHLLNWTQFFHTLGVTTDNNKTYIQVYYKKYFRNVFQELSSLPLDELVSTFSAILADQLFQNTVLPNYQDSRIEFCEKISVHLMPDIANYIYKRITSHEGISEKKTYLQNIFIELKEQFNDTIQNSEWLDDSSNISIENKLEKLQLEFTAEDLDAEEFDLEGAYSELQLKPKDYNYNFFKTIEFKRKSFFALHGKNVSPHEIFRYYDDYLKTGPIYFYGYSNVCIPYSLLREVSVDIPKYMNVATIGFQLAKIIGFAFDPIGIKYGTSLSQRSSMAYNHFLNKARDIKAFARGLSVGNREIVFNVDNYISESERFTENVAFRLLTDSVDAIQEQSMLPWISYKFSREKIFFIASAQELCQDMSLINFAIQAHENEVLPPQFRVLNMINNSEAFSEQCNCRSAPKWKRFQFPHVSQVIRKKTEKNT